MITSRRSLIGMVSAGAAIGLVRPAFAADSIKIGMTIPMTGAGATTGQLQTQGTKLAIEQVNAAGGVLGRKLELVMEDDQTTNPGMVLAFSRLVNRGDLAVILGSVRSTQVNAVAADIKKSGIPVFIGGSDPTLTHMGNPVDLPLPAQRQLFGQGDRRVRRQRAEEEQVGCRAFDRCIRRHRGQGC